VTPALIRFLFNAGVTVGLLAMSVGAGVALGWGAGLFAFGVVTWVTTIVSTGLAVLMLPRGG
jgi:hypothetical protein